MSFSMSKPSAEMLGLIAKNGRLGEVAAKETAIIGGDGEGMGGKFEGKKFVALIARNHDDAVVVMIFGSMDEIQEYAVGLVQAGKAVFDGDDPDRILND